MQMGLKTVDESDCDLLTRARVREEGVVIGAIWHIYHPRDADKIRDMLNKVREHLHYLIRYKMLKVSLHT